MLRAGALWLDGATVVAREARLDAPLATAEAAVRANPPAEALAVRLGDIIGDQVAANALARCFIRHARLAYASVEQTQARRKAARERWRRLATWYVRVLDEQPTKEPASRVVVQAVGEDDVRRFG